MEEVFVLENEVKNFWEQYGSLAKSKKDTWAIGFRYAYRLSSVWWIFFFC